MQCQLLHERASQMLGCEHILNSVSYKITLSHQNGKVPPLRAGRHLTVHL